jgi:hypothetical protein
MVARWQALLDRFGFEELPPHSGPYQTRVDKANAWSSGPDHRIAPYSAHMGREMLRNSVPRHHRVELGQWDSLRFSRLTISAA